MIELEVIGISGESMLTLNVADSMLGRELWRIILDKVPSKPGLQLVVSHTSKLVLNESLHSKDLGVNRHRCQLPTCPSICMLPGVLPRGTVLRMLSSH